jgi:hypothetical protein
MIAQATTHSGTQEPSPDAEAKTAKAHLQVVGAKSFLRFFENFLFGHV